MTIYSDDHATTVKNKVSQKKKSLLPSNAGVIPYTIVKISISYEKRKKKFAIEWDVFAHHNLQR